MYDGTMMIVSPHEREMIEARRNGSERLRRVLNNPGPEVNIFWLAAGTIEMLRTKVIRYKNRADHSESISIVHEADIAELRNEIAEMRRKDGKASRPV